MAATVMVRLPGELAEQIKARGHKREPFVRQAVEAALGHDGEASGTGRAIRPEASPAQAPSSKARRGAGSQSAAPAPPRAAATSAPVNHAMARQQKLNDAKYGRRS